MLRRSHFRWTFPGLALLLALLGVGVAFAAILPPPGVALRAGPAVGHTCPSLKRVKSFHGYVSDTFSHTATAQIDGSGYTESTSLHRSATRVRSTLKKLGGNGPLTFAGDTEGGSVVVKDSYESRPGLIAVSGKENYHGPAHAGPESSVLALFHKATCEYRVQWVVEVKAAFSGDADNPGTHISQWGETGWRHIPQSLKFQGQLPAYGFGGLCRFIRGHGCYSFSGGWDHRFEEDARCQEVYPQKGCEPGNPPVGAGKITWNLSPTFKK